jgi:deoxyribose-phosphate aldolase
MKELFNKYPVIEQKEKMDHLVTELIEKSRNEMTVNNLKFLVNSIDLTTLSTEDNETKVSDLCDKINRFQENFPSVPGVAAICIYPSLVPVAKRYLKEKNTRIASVAAGFPASLTFAEIKEKEIELAVAAGADEVDIVLSVGKFLEGKYDEVHDEIARLKKAAGKAELKVILETGALPDIDAVWKAAVLAMDAGTDFIKTSTGKISEAATPVKFFIMAEAIRKFYQKTNRIIGIKAAGGISTPEEALIYYTIVKNVLGEKWLNNKFFRIGASRLTNNLLGKILELSENNKTNILYY